MNNLKCTYSPYKVNRHGIFQRYDKNGYHIWFHKNDSKYELKMPYPYKPFYLKMGFVFDNINKDNIILLWKLYRQISNF